LLGPKQEHFPLESWQAANFGSESVFMVSGNRLAFWIS
jgi:hypothetical protein